MTEEKKSEKYKHYYKWKVSFNLFLLHLHKPLSEFNIILPCLNKELKEDIQRMKLIKAFHFAIQIQR